MEIKDAADAAEWLRAWKRGGGMRKGIKSAAVKGLRMSAAICRGAGNVEMARGYAEAADLIEREG